MKRFFWGAVIGILILIAVPLIVISSGGFNMAATEKPGVLETTLAGWTVDRSVGVRAPQATNPFRDDPEALETGLVHYRALCVHCHGAPQVESSEFARGLNPPARDLVDAAKEWTDGELFWIAKHGIRMTGMPAFGQNHGDEELWKIVAFVRKLDDLSESQVAALREGRLTDHQPEDRPAKAPRPMEAEDTIKH